MPRVVCSPDESTLVVQFAPTGKDGLQKARHRQTATVKIRNPETYAISMYSPPFSDKGFPSGCRLMKTCPGFEQFTPANFTLLAIMSFREYFVLKHSVSS